MFFDTVGAILGLPSTCMKVDNNGPVDRAADHFGSPLLAKQRRSLWIPMATGRRAEEEEETKQTQG